MRRGRALVKKQEIERVFKEGKRAGGGRLSALVLRREGRGFRAAYIVGKKLGGAVARNRTKRRLREAFRQVAGGGNGAADLVFMPRAGADATLQERLHDIEKIFKDAGFISR